MYKLCTCTNSCCVVKLGVTKVVHRFYNLPYNPYISFYMQQFNGKSQAIVFIRGSFFVAIQPLHNYCSPFSFSFSFASSINSLILGFHPFISPHLHLHRFFTPPNPSFYHQMFDELQSWQTILTLDATFGTMSIDKEPVMRIRELGSSSVDPLRTTP